jgi:hypothetical protein
VDTNIVVAILPWGHIVRRDEQSVISEAGRRFLVRLLQQLSDRQLRDLFEVGA